MQTFLVQRTRRAAEQRQGSRAFPAVPYYLFQLVIMWWLLLNAVACEGRRQTKIAALGPGMQCCQGRDRMGAVGTEVAHGTTACRQSKVPVSRLLW